MNSQLFFLLNLVFAIVFLSWFLSGRKNGAGRPTRLQMKKDSEKPGKNVDLPPPANDLPAKRGFDFVETASQTERAPGSSSDEPRRPKTKTLNVLFLYNGHDWDAYEVLGVPAGAGIQAVTARYQELIRGADKGKLEFYEAAYNAILKKV